MSATDNIEGLVAMQIGDALFGAPVLAVQDVIAHATLNAAPLAPPEVAGSLNLRGRIVTAIDMRRRLGLPARTPGQTCMSIIVERNGELYALQVDDVGDVLWLGAETREPLPMTLSAHWRSLSDSLYRLEDALLLTLNLEAVLTLPSPIAQPMTQPIASPSLQGTA